MDTRTTIAGLHVHQWGEGEPVVLVHGSLATGAEEWAEQRPLTRHRYRLLVPDRRGYGQSCTTVGEDFATDAADVADLLGDGAHLVGHSYGGLAAMFAAAKRPEATRSLTLLEPAVAECAPDNRAWRALLAELTALFRMDLPDRDWVLRFLTAVGSDGAGELPPEMLAAAIPLVPTLRRGRFFGEARVPFTALRQAPFPKLVVSGGHHAGFEAMCQDVAQRIGGSHRVIAGAGHEIQLTGQALNEALLGFWQSSARALPTGAQASFTPMAAAPGTLLQAPTDGPLGLVPAGEARDDCAL